MSNATDAYRRILKAIVNSEIKPGETVTELQLARRFGFGRTPVREAIMHLEHEGFIVSNERRKKVYILFPKDIEDIFVLKQSIESMISRKAAESTSARHREKLKDLLADMNGLSREAQDELFVQRWLEMDSRFHTLIFSMAQNERAEFIVGNLNLQFKRIKVGMMVLEGRVEKAIQEHIEIGDAIVSGDGEAAYRLMYEHLGDVKQNIIKIMNIFYS